MCLFLKTVNYHLWFLCKSGLYLASETMEKLLAFSTFQARKWHHLPHRRSDLGFMGTVVNQACPFLNDHTVLLRDQKRFINQSITCNKLCSLISVIFCAVSGSYALISATVITRKQCNRKTTLQQYPSVIVNVVINLLNH